MSAIRLTAAIAAFAFSLGATPILAQPAEPMTMEPVAIMVGDLAITQPWTRATPPGAVTGAGYLAITNNGTTDDVLLRVDAAIAEIGEIHEMSMVDERMMMRPLPDGLPIPAGETVVLQPGGFHLMFIQLGTGIVDGTMVPVTLTFERAGTVDLDLVAYPIGSSGPENAGGMAPMGGMHDMGGGM